MFAIVDISQVWTENPANDKVEKSNQTPALFISSINFLCEETECRCHLYIKLHSFGVLENHLFCRFVRK
jgi:hypothetical protein